VCCVPAEPLTSISVVYSTNPFDLPTLLNGSRLLNDSVVHCLPHGQIFVNPVKIRFRLKPELDSLCDVDRLSIYSSDTDMGEMPRWRRFRTTEKMSSGNVLFVEDETSDGKRSKNTATLTGNNDDELALVLTLHYFCMFAVVVEERKEPDRPELQQVRQALIRAYAKLRVGSSSFSVDVVLLIGCDKEAMVRYQFLVQDSSGCRPATLVLKGHLLTVDHIVRC